MQQAGVHKQKDHFVFLHWLAAILCVMNGAGVHRYSSGILDGKKKKKLLHVYSPWKGKSRNQSIAISRSISGFHLIPQIIKKKLALMLWIQFVGIWADINSGFHTTVLQDREPTWLMSSTHEEVTHLSACTCLPWAADPGLMLGELSVS